MARLSIAALLLVLAAGSAQAQPPKGVETLELAGKVGSREIGMNLTVRDNLSIDDAHYFYAGPLADIPLTAAVDGETVTLTEPGGGQFRLHFVSNGSAGGQALNFYNSTGLQGTWRRRAMVLPVSLGFDWSFPEVKRSPWYVYATHEPDAVFEARAQRFVRGALAGDRTMVARAVSYPLTVETSGRTLKIRTARQLNAHWAEVFPARFLSRLRDALPHEMFVHNGMAMILNGAVWFDSRGAAIVRPGL